MNGPLPLSMDDVDVVFAKLMLTYGTRFVDTYKGSDPFAIRQHWCHELRGLDSNQVLHALENLPVDHPPNVLQFRAIALAASRPVERFERLEAPKPSAAARERLNALLARMKAHPQRPTPTETWQRVLANPNSTITAREMARMGLEGLGKGGLGWTPESPE